MNPRRPALLVVAFGVVVAGALGCDDVPLPALPLLSDAAPPPDATPPPPAPDAAVEPAAPVPGAAPSPDEEHVFFRTGLMARVSDGAVGGLALRRPTAFLPRIGLEVALEAAGPAGRALVDALNATAGHDLTDPATWVRFGVDPDRPVGVAMLAHEPEMWVIGWSTTDAALQRTLIYAAAAGRVPLQDYDVPGMRLVGAADGTGPVVGWLGDDGFALFGPEVTHRQMVAAARRFADEELKLVGLSRVRFTQLRRPPDAMLMFDVPAVSEAEFVDLRDPDIEPTATAERRARLMSAFAVANRLRSDLFRLRTMDLVARGQRTWYELVLHHFADPLGPVVLGARFDDGSMRFEWALNIVRGTLQDRVFNQRAPDIGFDLPPTLEPAVDGTLRVDVDAVLDLARRLTVLAGLDIVVRVETLARSEYGVDLRRLAETALDGAFRLVVGQAKDVAGPSAVRVALAAGLADPDAIKAALHRLAQSAPQVTEQAPGRFDVDFGGALHVWVVVSGQQLTVANDPDLAAFASPPATAAPPAPDAAPPEALAGSRAEVAPTVLAEVIDRASGSAWPRIARLLRVMGPTEIVLRAETGKLNLTMTVSSPGGGRHALTRGLVEVLTGPAEAR